LGPPSPSSRSMHAPSRQGNSRWPGSVRSPVLGGPVFRHTQEIRRSSRPACPAPQIVYGKPLRMLLGNGARQGPHTLAPTGPAPAADLPAPDRIITALDDGTLTPCCLSRPKQPATSSLWAARAPRVASPRRARPPLKDPVHHTRIDTPDNAWLPYQWAAATWPGRAPRGLAPPLARLRATLCRGAQPPRRGLDSSMTPVLREIVVQGCRPPTFGAVRQIREMPPGVGPSDAGEEPPLLAQVRRPPRFP